MKKNILYFAWVLLAFLVMAVTACSSRLNAASTLTHTPTVNPVPAQEAYSDPFAYCAAVGTIDTPDARYTGPKISDEIINGFLAAADLQSSAEPMDILRQTTIWRCMDKQVYACNFGANLPCSSKANTDKTPTSEMNNYCIANPDSDFIPMSVTGHDTIYSWRCIKGAAELLNQSETVDTAGYLSRIWYPITPNPTPRP
jgi:hypothetical protein